LKQKYVEMGLPKSVLARTIGDTGVIVAPIIPWNVNAVLTTVTTGVSALQYGPYAILCYVLPIVTLLFGASGFIRENENNHIEQGMKIG